MMLPKEQVLASRLSIAMAEWPKESRANMVEWVTDALKEQRAAGVAEGKAALSAERARVVEECAKVAGTAEDDDDGIDRQLRKRIAAAIRALGKQTGGAS